ncbi:hypothetical protein J4410_05940 [Candidatus Woesearchaeota archaeon]|nr:hypothetical protein [Candidatus Woesearchaeota archaeon]
MKKKVFAATLLFVLMTVMTFAQTPQLQFTSFDVEIDDIDLTPSRPNPLDIERGESYPVEIRLASAQDYDDVEIRVFMSGFEYNDFESVEDRIAPFDMDANITYVKRFNIRFSDLVEEDLYQLRVVVSDRFSDLFIQNYPLKLDVPRHDLKIADIITLPSTHVQAGRALITTVRVDNYGEKDEDDVRVEVSIPSLGVTAAGYIEEVESEDQEESEELYVRIPDCAKEGTYELVVDVYYDEGFEKLTERVPIQVLQGDVCPNQDEEEEEPVDTAPQTLIVVGAQLQTLEQGGEGVLYPLTITNNGRASKTYSLLVQGVTFGNARVSPTSTVVLDAGASQTLYVFVEANKDAAPGPHTFTATVVSGSETLDQINLTAQVTEAPTSTLQTVLEVGLIVLVIILVIVALVVAFRRGKDNDEDEEDSTTETYY